MKIITCAALALAATACTVQVGGQASPTTTTRITAPPTTTRVTAPPTTASPVTAPPVTLAADSYNDGVFTTAEFRQWQNDLDLDVAGAFAGHAIYGMTVDLLAAVAEAQCTTLANGATMAQLQKIGMESWDYNAGSVAATLWSSAYVCGDLLLAALDA